MESRPSPEVTGLLQAWSAGDEEALQKLTPLVYRELHRAARHYMAGERSGHIHQATALINEVYLRLIDAKRMDWQNRAHFFGVCGQIDAKDPDGFRALSPLSRGGGATHISLDGAVGGGFH